MSSVLPRFTRPTPTAEPGTTVKVNPDGEPGAEVPH
jgi:hypothetical protein